MSVTWESINEGDALPVLRKTPDLAQLVKYSAGSGDFNPLHHDYDFPQSRALGSILVHGRYKYALLGELIMMWLQHRGRIRKISCQYKGMDQPGNEILCTGRVMRKYEDEGRRLVNVAVWTENSDGKKTTPGLAVIEFD